ncbi:hypothetical protein BP5796_09881 [Coleophoma crateriformis]|uniref:Uncharacterized protein n=1 Tax=Coleophoma crateriformis TaxID=565419 RepID=A0A3D8QTS2_9HELO|nr:hypothetical protein BP5796_09881 [Coleophoma crateriformis]
MEAKKSVLITGCSVGGIGDALAQCFHRRKFRVFATARDLSKVEHLKEMGMDVLELDVIDTESIKRAVKHVSAATGNTLNYLYFFQTLVVNGGEELGGMTADNWVLAYGMPLLDVDIATAQAMFDTNVFGVLRMTQDFAPLLIHSKGMIINISSVAAYVPSPFTGAYNATKAALTMMTNILRYEMRPFDVKVVVVTTGAVASNIFDNQPKALLPSQSLYNKSKLKVEEVMKGGKVTPSFMPASEYAERVVTNATSARPKLNFWAGGNVKRIRLVTKLLGQRGWDAFLPGPFGINEVEKNLEKSANKK